LTTSDPSRLQIEVATESPQQGIIFYRLPQKRQEKPQFDRKNDCLTCHDSYDAWVFPECWCAVILRDKTR
jgi:hypothetical protein